MIVGTYVRVDTQKWIHTSDRCVQCHSATVVTLQRYCFYLMCLTYYIPDVGFYLLSLIVSYTFFLKLFALLFCEIILTLPLSISDIEKQNSIDSYYKHETCTVHRCEVTYLQVTM